MATANLGRVGFVNKGAWVDGVHKINDVVQYINNIYACTLPHTSTGGDILPTNTMYWEKWTGYNADGIVNTPSGNISSTNVQSAINELDTEKQSKAPYYTGAYGSIASSATMAIGAAIYETVHVTGTTTITSFDIVGAGVTRTLIFDGILTLTHNAISLILPSSANIITAAGDTAIFVSEGSGNWRCISYTKKDGTPVIAPGSAQIFPVTASVSANALTISLNPTKLDFRSATLANGTVNTRTITSTISMTVSNGSTLGTANGISARLVLIAIDNAGTVELAITNLAGGLNLDETTLITTTAEGGAGAADSINTIYSTTARTNVPFRIVGFIDITEATAGVWATSPTLIQGAGGEALIMKNLLIEYTVTGSAVTSIDFTGLDINTHKSYRIEIEAYNPTGSTNAIYMYCNNDTTATNYYIERIDANGTGLTSARANLPTVCEVTNANTTVTTVILHSYSGYIFAEILSTRNIGATTIHQSVSYSKSTTVTNLTQLTFTATVASSIGIGSKIRIYRGDL